MNEQDRHSLRWKPTPGDMILMSVEGISFLAQVVLCIPFYNSLNLNWILYLAWAILAVAMVLAWRARVAFQAEGGSREGESWLHTRTVVATGVYAVVRHPMYLSFLLMSLSLVLLSQHWLNALLGAIVMGLLYNDMCREERSNLERFGDDYQRYMEHVPRMNIAAGTIRLLQVGIRGQTPEWWRESDALCCGSTAPRPIRIDLDPGRFR
jgi:protein-S-isoprenylcysteine O-methyltransferase Ste14